MSEERLLNGQRYFISKLLEFFDVSSHQLPVFYKALQDKRYDSIILMFNEFLEIEKEIREGTSDKTKLKHSMNSSLKSIKYHCKNNPWALKGDLSRDIDYLVKEIETFQTNEEKHKDYTRIRLAISSITKRSDSDSLIKDYIDLLLKSPLSYKEIDLLVQYFFSEIINLGYSMKYLIEWKQQYKELNKFTNDLSKEELEDKLFLFNELVKEPSSYLIIINSWLPDELKDELYKEDNVNIKYRYCKIEADEEKLVTEQADKLNYPKAEQYQTLIVEVMAYDKYKAIEKVVKNLESYLEMYKHHYSFNKKAVNVNCLLKSNEGVWEKMRTDNVDTQIFNKSMSDRENEDIRDFILLRDKVRIDEGKINTSINQLNNSLETLRKSIDDSPENRLLNNWSSLEYILNSYEGKSIIGKVIDIVPKVICMYHVKDQLNILWENLSKYKGSKDYKEIEIIESLFQLCSRDKGKYDKNSFVNFLASEKKLRELYDCLEGNVVIHREIAYIKDILLNIKRLKENVMTLHELIEHDLTRIYRLRNKLVHSDNNISFNSDIFTIRLNKYINSLIGTLIHYLKRQPNLHISEVLNSIHETYKWYIDFLEKEEIKEKELKEKEKKTKGKDQSSDMSEELEEKLYVDIATAAFPPYLYL